MEDSYSIQISGNLVKQLATEGEKYKKKPRKPKTKTTRSPQRSETKVTQKEEILDTPQTLNAGPTATGWPLQPPFFLPPPPPTSTNPELEAIKSTLHESEKIVERLQKQEEDLAKEVTERAKELHDKEFKLPYQKPMPCLADYNSCLDCYKEHAKDPLKCANLVKRFADCARSARQKVNSAGTEISFISSFPPKPKWATYLNFGAFRTIVGNSQRHKLVKKANCEIELLGTLQTYVNVRNQIAICPKI